MHGGRSTTEWIEAQDWWEHSTGSKIHSIIRIVMPNQPKFSGILLGRVNKWVRGETPDRSASYGPRDIHIHSNCPTAQSPTSFRSMFFGMRTGHRRHCGGTGGRWPCCGRGGATWPRRPGGSHRCRSHPRCGAAAAHGPAEQAPWLPSGIALCAVAA